MMLERGKWINHAVPTYLPCGKKVNQVYVGAVAQCCKTECGTKDYKEIDHCYSSHKRGAICLDK
jgi:hypothetical protein